MGNPLISSESFTHWTFEEKSVQLLGEGRNLGHVCWDSITPHPVRRGGSDLVLKSHRSA